ncbi:MAG: hypothetical protein ACTSQE_05835 [Candidatus Heimdallarchaeaceae archaeon]
MKKIKKLTFNVNQSRRIIRSAESHKTEPKELLKIYQDIVDSIYEAWSERYEEEGEVDFQTFFLALMKYAEVVHRLEKSKNEMKEIRKMANLLNEAIEEYKTDYQMLVSIENSLKNLGVEWV